jgi:hypothetical protein
MRNRLVALLAFVTAVAGMPTFVAAQEATPTRSRRWSGRISASSCPTARRDSTRR